MGLEGNYGAKLNDPKTLTLFNYKIEHKLKNLLHFLHSY